MRERERWVREREVRERAQWLQVNIVSVCKRRCALIEICFNVCRPRRREAGL